jgi:SAM-dependent methyltransferase
MFNKIFCNYFLNKTFCEQNTEHTFCIFFNVCMEEQLVKNYYDENISGKLNDFINGSLRIDKAWQTLRERTGQEPGEVLEIGCGIGAVCDKASRLWKKAQITGIDISPKSIEIATRLFGSEKVKFTEGILQPSTFQQSFDLIILMDVYEHIAIADRPVLHESIAKLLSVNGKIFLSCPTPRFLAYLKQYQPIGIQPVDEDIDFQVIHQLAQETGTEVLLYSEVNVWHPGDYVHILLSKPQPAWTPASFKQNIQEKNQHLRLQRILHKLFRNNPVFSLKTIRRAFVGQKMRDE